MDTEKKSRIPECGNVPDLAGVKTVVGAKQLKKAVEAGRVRYVFLAENADPAVTAPIALLCRSKKVQTAWVPSMAELGRACGIEVGAAAAAVGQTFAQPTDGATLAAWEQKWEEKKRTTVRRIKAPPKWREQKKGEN